jgi:hypothetical protein
MNRADIFRSKSNEELARLACQEPRMPCPKGKQEAICSNTDCYECFLNYLNEEVEEITPKTNADRIRSMTDEELARFLGDEPPYFSTYEKYLDWLKQPAKEELI